MTDLQSFMKILLNNHEGGAPPEIVSDNARVLLSASRRASGSCNKVPRSRLQRRQQTPFAINETNTQGEENMRLTRWVSTSPTPQTRRTASNIVVIPAKITRLAAPPLRTSRKSSSTSRPRLYRHASLPPICPTRKQSVELNLSVLAPTASA